MGIEAPHHTRTTPAFLSSKPHTTRPEWLWQLACSDGLSPFVGGFLGCLVVAFYAAKGGLMGNQHFTSESIKVH